MAYHPDLKIDYSYEVEGGGYETRVKRSRSGKTQKNRNRLLKIRRWVVALDWLTNAQAQPWLDFWNARFGSWDNFYWFSPETTTENGIYVGLGDGTSNAFNLPIKGAAATPVIKANGTPVAGTWTVNGGTGGEDLFDPSGTVTLGATVTVDFVNARIRPLVAFMDDDYKQRTQFREGSLQRQFSFRLEEELA